MKTKRGNMSLIVVILVVSTISLISPLLAEEETSILERVQTIKDPELAELIQIAIDNLPETKISKLKTDPNSIMQADLARSKAVQVVTEQYVQIKLLDEKIKQLNKKIDGSKNPEEIGYELLLAKTSLETEQFVMLSKLREALHLIPNYPFGTKETNKINTWIYLEVFGNNTIRLFKFIRPFNEEIYRNSSKDIKLMSPEEAINNLEAVIKQKDVVPLRITFSSTGDGVELANNLRAQIRNMAKKEKIDYDIELPKTDILKNDIIQLLLVNDGYVMELGTNVSQQYKTINEYIDMQGARFQKPCALPIVYKIIIPSGAKPSPEEMQKTKSELRNMISRSGYEDYISIDE